MYQQEWVRSSISSMAISSMINTLAKFVRDKMGHPIYYHVVEISPLSVDSILDNFKEWLLQMVSIVFRGRNLAHNVNKYH